MVFVNKAFLIPKQTLIVAFESLFTLDYEMIFRIVLATLLGSLVGIERELMHKPAGLRTHMLVSLGASIFTVVSLSFSDDPARIASGIVTGIGFLGAGSIIALRGHVQGITTAATLWVSAGIGLATGMGEYILAIIGTLLTFGILRFRRVEEKFISEKVRKSSNM
jgi:putative Mg2+ transporter-C (MgtC) family protein